MSVLQESRSARTLVLWVRGWPGHLAGQHVDVRLTAEDGYSAVRSYSIASAPGGETIEVTIEHIEDGEVSTYLAHEVREGDLVEVRGPIGGWFVWRPTQREPIQLVAGGSGIAPLMAMVRAGVAAGAPPMRLLYSTRSTDTLIYGDELTRLASEGKLHLTTVFTRVAPEGWDRPPKRIDTDLLPNVTWPASTGTGEQPPTCYVCGPSPFVETAVRLLQAARHDERNIRTERFGPT
jgi:ferredoxin-NADP reductase